ncbi:MAG: hypothetical protein Q9208_005401 [Pyrenodesmia sp. 3 TL-2023]
MGGAAVLHFAAYGPSDTTAQISGYICESPLIAIHEDTQPSRFVVVVGKLAAKVIPKRQMVQKIDPKFLCRDESMYKEFEADELCHDTGTLEGLAGMLQRAEDLDAGKVSLKNISLWVGHGTEDRVTSFKATARFMDRLDEDRAKFADDVAGWVLARSTGFKDSSNAVSKPKSRL